MAVPNTICVIFVKCQVVSSEIFLHSEQILHLGLVVIYTYPFATINVAGIIDDLFIKLVHGYIIEDYRVWFLIHALIFVLILSVLANVNIAAHMKSEAWVTGRLLADGASGHGQVLLASWLRTKAPIVRIEWSPVENTRFFYNR